MSKTYRLTNEDWRKLSITQEGLQLISKYENRLVLWNAIQMVAYEEKSNKIAIRYQLPDKEKPALTIIQLRNKKELPEITGMIKELVPHLQEKREKASLKMILVTYAVPLVATVLLTWGMYEWAVEIQSGVEQVYSGRRALWEAILGKVIGALGPVGVIIVGSLIAGYYGYRVLKPKIKKVVLI